MRIKNLSVIILIVHEHGVFLFECKRQPPVGADVDRPVVFETAMQGMQPPAGCVHVLLGSGVVEGSQLQSQLVGMLGLNSRLGPSLEELLDILVPKALDHSV